jgi:hypothetical protein
LFTQPSRRPSAEARRLGDVERHGVRELAARFDEASRLGRVLGRQVAERHRSTRFRAGLGDAASDAAAAPGDEDHLAEERKSRHAHL